MTVQQNGVSVLNEVGIIIPPPEVKEILETTAAFVGKNPAFEARVLREHENDGRFSFLNSSDPYHAYYRKKVEELRQSTAKRPRPGDSKPQQNGSTPDESSSQKDGTSKTGKGGEDDPKNTTRGEAVVSFLKSVEVKEHAARPEPREAPPEDLFTILNVNPTPQALGLDVMKLTAQFVATHGSEFQKALAAKEARNGLFDFLKPLHPHFILFQRLVDAYKALQTPGPQKEELISKFAAHAQDESAIMDEVWYLHDWECLRAEREHEAEMDEGERLRAAQIDWHDFVVLETVDFEETDKSLPAPVTDTSNLPKMLAAARRAELEREKNRDIDMEVDGGESRVVAADVNTDIPRDRVRKGGAVGSSGVVGEATVVLPSGQRVGLSQAEQSIRAELLNPAYKTERERAGQKAKVRNLAGGEEMARNLARLSGGTVGAGAGQSGPRLPDADAGVERGTKRARVEAAVGALVRGREVVEEEAGVEEKMEGKMEAIEWVKKVGTSAVVRIVVPKNGNKEWKLQGQVLEMAAKLMSSVGKLKTVVGKHTKVPVKKQKLMLEGVGFLKDDMSLAYYNVKEGDVIRLELKERGGRKKHS